MTDYQIMARSDPQQDFEAVGDWCSDEEVAGILAQLLGAWLTLCSIRRGLQEPTQEDVEKFQEVVKVKKREDGVVSDAELSLTKATQEEMENMKPGRTLN